MTGNEKQASAQGMASNRRPSTWSSLLPSTHPEGQKDGVTSGVMYGLDASGIGVQFVGQPEEDSELIQKTPKMPLDHPQAPSGGSMKSPRIDGGWLGAAKRHARKEAEKKAHRSAGSYHHELSSSVLVDLLVEKSQKAQSDARCPGIEMQYEADDLVVAGGSLNYNTAANPSGTKCQPSRNRGTYFDRTLSRSEGRSPGNRSPPKTPLKESPRVASISAVTPINEIQMFESPDMPRVMVVRRSETAKIESPNKLMLDHCNLKECCMLEGEEDLRLLNYEHNHISQISNMEGLQHLVFLDLFSNCLERISGLEALTNLKYLLLGRNYIRRIANLEGLRFLDVLDLHDNLLDSMDGVGGLTSLRVLNLAGNRINGMRNIVRLTSLVELNLKRNFLLSLAPVDAKEQPMDSSDCTPCLPGSLLYLFLSHNRIASLDALLPLTHLSQLCELSLDGNPVGNSMSPRAYRKEILELCPSNIQVLDSQTITGEELCWSSSATAKKAFEAEDDPNCMDSPKKDGCVWDKGETNAAEIASTSSNHHQKEEAQLGARHSSISDLGDWESEHSILTNEGSGELSWRTYEWTKPGKKPQAQKPPHPKSSRNKPEHATELGSPPYSPFGGCTTAQDNRTTEQKIANVGVDQRGVEAPQDDTMSSSVRTVSSGTSDTFSMGARESPLTIESCSLAANVSNRREDAMNSTDVAFTKAQMPSVVNNALGGKRDSNLNKALSRHYWSRSNPAQSKDPPEQGVVELLDGHRLCLYGNVLYALGNASAAHVTDVCIKYIGWDAVASSVPRLAALARLKKLVFEHNRLDFLSQLDCLRGISRIQSLTIQFNPVASLALFGAYVAHKLPQVKTLNGQQITEIERAKGTKLFQPVQEAIQTRGNAFVSGISVEGSKSVPALITKRSTQGYVNRMLCDAMAAERRIRKLDDVWDSIVIQHLKEGFRQAKEVVQFYGAVSSDTDNKAEV